MASGLEDLPNEVVESITVLLNLRNIRALRLVSRTLASAATQSHFKSYFRSKRVELTEAALQAFLEFTRCGRLGRLLQDLTLVGVARQSNPEASYEAKQNDDQHELHIKLLSQALTFMKASKGFEMLSSLSLEVAVLLETESGYHPQPLTSKWRTAGESLACDKLSPTDLKAEGLSESFAGLTTLSLNLSDRITENVPSHEVDWSQSPEPSDIHRAEAKAADEHNFDGLEQLLQLCTQLRSLKVHYYRLDGALNLLRHSEYHGKLIQRLGKAAAFPHLTDCQLQGLHARDKDLLRLIRGTAPKDLSLENVTLTAGNFDPIFDHCTSEAAGIEHLYIDDLCAEQTLLYFDGVGSVGKPHIPLTGEAGRIRSSSSNTFKRAGAEITQNVSYHYHEGGPTLDTAQTRKWRNDRNREYGWGQVQPPFIRNASAFR
ncbi:hypothetical protein LTR37_001316 [Vermiconidia calcicola]|uniref:Uncharacterized protein n=1 Tax=Vermiconidia calcicola TaxID=1690605 RepID=A0ACC3NWP6_9PEZI|nr:hypothetical protein LTR37_001316 [Vermiconidia calcicola]